jgi:hypothetical protein
MGLHNKVRKEVQADTAEKLANSTINNSFDDEVEVNLQIPIDKPN